MKKYKYIIGIIIGCLILIPNFVLAAVVTFDADTTITVPTGNVSFTVSSGSTADELTVNTDSVRIAFSAGQSVTIVSAERRKFSFSSYSHIRITRSSNTTITLTLPSGEVSETITVTPLDDFFTGGGGGGGGSGSSGGTTTPTPVTTVETPTTTETPVKTAYEVQLENIVLESQKVFAGKTEVLANVGKTEDMTAEKAVETKYIAPLVSGAGVSVSSESKGRMVSFVNYGTETTLRLGAGERAGVLYCFEDAYGKLPTTQDDWDDVVKIANGRWPKQTVVAKEAAAEKIFKEIYLRAPDRTNPHDDAAVVIITYGLKPTHRSLDNERAALKTFKYIYDGVPDTNLEWKIVRAIAESGAKR